MTKRGYGYDCFRCTPKVTVGYWVGNCLQSHEQVSAYG